MNSLSSIGLDVRALDTHTKDNSRLPIDEREGQLQEFLDAFRRAQVVVTDRLHGMVFSAVTGTPCVVFGSKSHKVRATYECWMSGQNYVRFQDDFDPDHTVQLIETLAGLSDTDIQPPDLSGFYDPLREAVAGQT